MGLGEKGRLRPQVPQQQHKTTQHSLQNSDEKKIYTQNSILSQKTCEGYKSSSTIMDNVKNSRNNIKSLFRHTQILEYST